MVFNPLLKVEESTKNGYIPMDIYKTIKNRFHLVAKGIKRIETASNLNYPFYYVEPNLILCESEIETANVGIFFARTIPIPLESNELRIIVQISAPLIAYGLLGTIHAILAHEFMHYLDLVNRIIHMNITSEEIADTLFEETYLDDSRALDPRIVFRQDRTLTRHILNRFPQGFKDVRLEEKVIRHWISQGLPTSKVPINTNAIKIPIELVSRLNVDEIVRKKIIEFENLGQTLRKKSMYGNDKRF